MERSSSSPYTPNIFTARNKYASIYLQEFNDVYVLEYVLTEDIFQDHISALHIHSNVKGQPGPILVWLMTTPKWQSGVLQLTPGKNSPCCIKMSGSHCALVAPDGTSFLDSLSPRRLYKKIISKNVCGNTCPGITQERPHGFLVVHGDKFQKVDDDGCLTNGEPGLDVLIATPLERLTNNNDNMYMTPNPYQ